MKIADSSDRLPMAISLKPQYLNRKDGELAIFSPLLDLDDLLREKNK
jgi:hypothetical protein